MQGPTPTHHGQPTTTNNAMKHNTQQCVSGNGAQPHKQKIEKGGCFQIWIAWGTILQTNLPDRIRGQKCKKSDLLKIMFDLKDANSAKKQQLSILQKTSELCEKLSQNQLLRQLVGVPFAIPVANNSYIGQSLGGTPRMSPSWRVNTTRSSRGLRMVGRMSANRSAKEEMSAVTRWSGLSSLASPGGWGRATGAGGGGHARTT